MHNTITNLIIPIVIVLMLWSLWGVFSSRVEQADYTVVRKANDYEMREYPARIVAQTTVRGSYGEALNDGFRIVAGYIFGGNTKKESIAMTAPVTDQRSVSEKIAMTAPVLATTAGDSHVITFGMSRSYTLETLPTPHKNEPPPRPVCVSGLLIPKTPQAGALPDHPRSCGPISRRDMYDGMVDRLRFPRYQE